MFNYDLPSDHPSSLTMSHQVLRNDQPGSSSATGLVGGRGIDEHRRLFQPSRLYNQRTGGKGKGPSSENPTVKKARKQNTCTYWKKNSFCLSSCDQVLKPNPQQRIQLARLGLKTKVLLFEVGGTAHHVHNVITQEYPVLESCGGYSLLRLAENSHNLVEIEDPLDVLIDVEYLKNILNNATLYIRPLQRDISPDDMKQLTLTEVHMYVLVHLYICIVLFDYISDNICMPGRFWRKRHQNFVIVVVLLLHCPNCENMLWYARKIARASMLL